MEKTQNDRKFCFRRLLAIVLDIRGYPVNVNVVVVYGHETVYFANKNKIRKKKSLS